MNIKGERLSLRLSAEDKKQIKKQAIDKNMKISEYIMDLIEKDINKVASGNNVNIEYGKIKSSVECINRLLNSFKDSELPLKTNIPLVLPLMNDLIQELKDLGDQLKAKNLID